MRLRVFYADGDFRETHYSLWRGLPRYGVIRLEVEDPAGRTWQAVENWEHLHVQPLGTGVRLLGFRTDSDGVPYGWVEWRLGPHRAILDAPTEPDERLRPEDCLHRVDGTKAPGVRYKALVGNIPASWWRRLRLRHHE